MYNKLLEMSEAPRGAPPKENDVYKVIILHGKRFEIKYGYYEEIDRAFEPVPIYPDFISEPVYTAKGIPFATAYQDVCEHYVAKPNINSEKWCDKCCKSTSQKNVSRLG